MDLFPFSKVREKQDQLMQDVEEAVENGESLVAHAPTGIGKCVSADTQVLTSSGIGSIDNLIGKNVSVNSFNEGLKSEISDARLVKKEESNVLDINTYTGREVKVTRDHKLLRIKNGEIEWVEAKKIDEGDYIASPRSLDLPEVDFDIRLSDLNDRPTELRVCLDKDISDVIEELKRDDEFDRGLSDRLEIPRKNFTSIRNNDLVKLKHVVRIVEESSKSLDEFKIEKVSWSNGNKIEVPEINEEFSYFLGLMLGDGGIFGKERTICMSTADKEVKEFFYDIMESFDTSVREVHGDDYSYKANNRALVWLLEFLGLPVRKKNDITVPNCVLTCEENLSAFVSGLFDTDGCVDNSGKLEFCTKSSQLANQLLVLLPVFGIRPIRKYKKADGNEYHRIFILNQKDIERFKENIGFKIERKQERLESIDKDYNPNKDVIPEIADVIHSARKKSGIEYSRESLRRRLESYEYGSRRPSREGLSEVIDEFNFKDCPETRKLRKLIEAEVFWDKVESTDIKGKEEVYDLTVPKNHNFTGNNLILHNTAGVLTPTLEYALNNNKKVFFLTPRHSQHQIAVETVKKIQKVHDVDLTVVDLLGKKWLCNVDGVEQMTSGDFKDYCQTLRDEERCDFYTAMYDMDEHKLKDKAKDKLDDMEGSSMHASEFKDSNPHFCPYYMMMELARRSNLVIADYFHIFHPGVRDSIFERCDVQLEDAILIVDEAHNLPSRTRSLFSTSLSIPQIDRALTEVEKFGFYEEEEKLERLESVVKSLAAEKFEAGSHEEKIKKKDLKESISNFTDYEKFIVDLESVAEEVREEQERSYCGGIAEFLDDWNGDDNGYFRGIRRKRSSSGNRYIQIQYSCLDPQVSTKEALNQCHSSILMSGTLTPQSMYVDLLGLNPQKTNTRAFKSPFPEENQLNLLVDTVTTKYSDRGDDMSNKYVWYLSRSFEAVDGNCAVFFPSYSMMKEMKKMLEQRTDRQLFMERQDMNKEEKQEMVDDFASRKEEGDSVLLGVAAGSFGEGVDYPGEVLKGVFIVGLPLQRPDLETKALINFYDYKFGKGWDYGYSYPAMNRSMQAAGRCIRSKDDKGVIVYMDKRYGWSNYRKVFPPGKKLKKTKAPWKEIEEFF